MNKLPVLSVVIPVHNEAENIEWFYEELKETLSSTGKPFELIYVDDGSTDNTGEIISNISKNDPDVQYVCLARNFGKEAATSAGIHYARGGAAIILDGDGQHPSSKIPEMVDLWESGFQHVVGIRSANERAGFVKTVGSRLFYSVAKVMGANGLTPNSTDFRLIDREVIEAFKLFNEKKRMTRALLDWSGFRTTNFTFEARDRTKGTASYKFGSLFRLAMNGYIGATLKPLYFIGLLGAAITTLSFLLLAFLALSQLVFDDPLQLGVSGTAYIALFVTFLVGLLMVSQGIIAAYVANIQLESQDRPLYLVNQTASKLSDKAIRS